MSTEQRKPKKRSATSNPVAPRSYKGILGKSNSNEAEAVRLQLLAEFGETEEAPGRLEALQDRAYLADCFFEEHVLQDPACLRSSELFHQAWRIAEALADFYQRVGQEVGKEPAPVSSGSGTGAKP